jgi:hypothetical protein
MRAFKIILVGTLVAIPGVLWAITGCLTEEKELVPRASVIIVGKIERIETVQLPPCPSAPVPERGKQFVTRYEKCGAVSQLTIRPKQALRGSVEPTVMTVLMADEGVLVLGCDDRPPVEKLPGLEAVMFLENSGGRLWTLDGPNSIYSWPGAVDAASIARLKDLLSPGAKQP